MLIIYIKYHGIYFHNLAYLLEIFKWTEALKSQAHALQSTSCFSAMKKKKTSKHHARMSHCKTLSRADCKTLLNLDHKCFVLVLDVVFFNSLSLRWYFHTKETTQGHIVSPGNLWLASTDIEQGKFAECSTKKMPVVFKKTGLNMTEMSHCVSCLQTTIPTLPSYWGLMLASVWRGKSSKHNPVTFPLCALCPC